MSVSDGTRRRRSAPAPPSGWDMLGDVTPEEFVEVIRMLTVDRAAEETVRVLRTPPGRQPRSTTVRRSEWFNSLGEADRQMVAEVAREAAFMSAFDPAPSWTARRLSITTMAG